MNVRFFYIVLAFALLILLLCSQLLGGGLNLLGYHKQQLTTILSNHEMVGEHLAAQIQRSLHFGKPLANFVGMENILSKGLILSEGSDFISVYNLEGKQLYAVGEKMVPSPLWFTDGTVADKKSRHFRTNDSHFVVLPLYGISSEVKGFLCFGFSDKQLRRAEKITSEKAVVFFLWCSLGAVIVLFVAIWLGRSFAGDNQKAMTWVFMIVLSVSQLACSWYVVRLFQADYLQLTRIKAEISGNLVKRDVELLLSKGLALQKLRLLDKQLEEEVAPVPELAYLAVLNADRQLLYHGGAPRQPDEGFFQRLPLQREGKSVGYIEVGLSRVFVQQAVREIVYNSLTIVLICLLVAMELLFFLLDQLYNRTSVVRKEKQKHQVQTGITLVRMAIFAYVLAASLSQSFIPLQMECLYRPLWGLSKEFLVGLPLSLEMLGGTLVLLPAGRWIDVKGWHYPFLTGVLLSACGMFFSGFSEEPLTFIVSRFVVGVGYGLSWMSAQGFVVQHASSEDKTRQISLMVAGIFSGVICGSGMGGVLAEHLGFERVFFIAAVLMLMTFIFVWGFMCSAFLVPQRKVVQRKEPWLKIVLCSRELLLVFLFSLLPYSIGMVALLYYVTPVYLNAMGVNQADIGRVIMIFGLCMIFIAPRVSKYADKVTDKRWFVYLGGVLGSVALLVSGIGHSLWSLAGGVLIFGFSVSISGASRNVLVLHLPAAQSVGALQLMGMYRTVDKLGQTLGALVPATLVTFFSMDKALFLMGAVYLSMTLFLFFGLWGRFQFVVSTRK